MIETGKEKNANIPQLQVTCQVKYVDYELLTTEKVEELRKSDYYTTQDHIDTFVFSFLSDTLPKEKIKEFKDAYRGLIYEIFLNIQQHAARTSQHNEVKVDISCEILKNAYDEQVLQMKVRDYGPGVSPKTLDKMQQGLYGFTTKEGVDAQCGGNGCCNIKRYADSIYISNSYPGLTVVFTKKYPSSKDTHSERLLENLTSETPG